MVRLLTILSTIVGSKEMTFNFLGTTLHLVFPLSVREPWNAQALLRHSADAQGAAEGEAGG